MTTSSRPTDMVSSPRTRGSSVFASAAIARIATIAICALALASCGLRSSRLTPVAKTSADWPVWRANHTNTGATLTSSTPQIDTLLWRIKTGGVAVSEPVVRGGYLYFGGWDRRLEVFDAKSGDRVFRERFDGPVTGVVPEDSTFIFATDQDERKLYRYAYNPASEVRHTEIPTSSVPPRVLDDGSVIICGMHGALMRIDTAGNTIWTVNLESPITATPAIDDSLVLIAVGKGLNARSIATGVSVWTHSASGAITASPAVGAYVYFGSTDSLVYAVERTTGNMVWFFAANGQVLTTPTVGDSLVYVASNDRNIYALRAATGEKVWSYDTGAPAKNNVTLAGNLLLAGSLLNKLLVLDARNGELRRTFNLQSQAVTAPIVADGKVYIADLRRRLYCFGSINSISASTKN